MENLNIYQRMSKITEKINRVAKNLRVGIGQSQYKAVGEADVLAEVKPAEIEFGVYSYPIHREVILTDTLTSTTEYKGEQKERITIFMRIKTIYRFVNIDNPEDFLEIETLGDGVDTQDKAPGKAMTYADKYAFLKAYKIETGEDPDQRASEQLKPIELITEEQMQQLLDMGTDLQAMAKYYKKSSIDRITKLEANQAIQSKTKRLQAQEKPIEKEI